MQSLFLNRTFIVLYSKGLDVKGCCAYRLSRLVLGIVDRLVMIPAYIPYAGTQQTVRQSPDLSDTFRPSRYYIATQNLSSYYASTHAWIAHARDAVAVFTLVRSFLHSEW